MSIQIICDCCKEPTEKAVERGFLTKRHYCEKCQVHADKLDEDVDKIHTDLVERFTKDLQGLRNHHRKKLKRLPDESDI